MRMTGATAGPVFTVDSSRPPARVASSVDQRRIPGEHALALLAEVGDAKPHFIAGLQERRRLHPETDTRRRPGGDQVAGVERHETAHIAHEVRDAEDHGLGAAVLAALAVDVEPHRELLRILDLVGRHQPRTDGAEGVATLSLVPGAAALDLVFALGH